MHPLHTPCGLFLGLLLFENVYQDPIPEDLVLGSQHDVLFAVAGEADDHSFGFCVRNLGDTDSDGVDDFAVGAPGWCSPELGKAGAVYVFSGATGVRRFRRIGEKDSGMGVSLAACGDVDGDGVPDVLVGAPGSSSRADTNTPGRAYVFSGRDGTTLLRLSAGATDARFGHKVSGMGDVDEDGRNDLLVAAPFTDLAGADTGRVHAFSGADGEPLFVLDGEEAGARFGLSVAGDEASPPRIAVGAPGAGSERRGRVHVLRVEDGEPVPSFTIEPAPTSRELGSYYLSFVGDVDGDGDLDVLASDYADDARGPDTGRIVVHSGRTGERLLELRGDESGAGFGSCYGRVGDVDGDGRDDVGVGAWHASGVEPGAGAVFVYSGRDGRRLLSVKGGLRGATLGHDVTGAGDVDGDGRVDLLISNAGNSGLGQRVRGHVLVISGAAQDE